MDTRLPAELLEVAASWHARLSASDCTGEDRARFAHWFAGDVSHMQAFQQVKRTADAAAHLARTDARLLAMADAAFDEEPGSPERRSRQRAQWGCALAASVLVCFGVARWAPNTSNVPLESASYATTLQTRTVTLSDGSHVQLDAGTLLAVEMYESRRVIKLERGRAFFKVAHDAQRPFAVTSEGVQTVALGTEFEVDHEARGVMVTLLQGSVLVSDVSQESSNWEEKLHPGEQLLVEGPHGAPQRRVVDIAQNAGWTRGRHVFEHTPLAAAIEEVNRYSERKLRLGDQSLANLEIGGNFVMGDAGDIAHAIAAALPIDVVEAGPRELILFSRHEQLID